VIDSLIVCCETPAGGYYMPLFVKLEPGVDMSDTLRSAIVRRLRDDASPRHVPDEIHDAPAIPYTLTGKKMEVPIRKIIMGMTAEQAASRESMANPAVLTWYADFAMRPEVIKRRLPAVN
jgi:acetoacetyl-CoA synthetase